MIILKIYLAASAFLIGLVVFHHWYVMSQRQRQIWGISILLVYIAEQMQNQIEKLVIPDWVVWAIILNMAMLFRLLILAPKPVYPEDYDD